MIYYYCSNGMKVTQSVINSRYRLARMEKHQENPFPVCECCGHTKAHDNDHTIPQARLKVLNRTEKIWDPKFFVSSCRTCHEQWEAYGDGKFVDHKNFADRMTLVADYDPETFIKRLYAVKEHNPDLEIDHLVKQANERKLKIALG